MLWLWFGREAEVTAPIVVGKCASSFVLFAAQLGFFGLAFEPGLMSALVLLAPFFGDAHGCGLVIGPQFGEAFGVFGEEAAVAAGGGPVFAGLG